MFDETSWEILTLIYVIETIKSYKVKLSNHHNKICPFSPKNDANGNGGHGSFTEKITLRFNISFIRMTFIID